MKVLGIDPSLSNCGFVLAELDLTTLDYQVEEVLLIETKKGSDKRTRRNSDDLERARQLSETLDMMTTKAKLAFCEVPVGSQSARAMASYGVCIGVLSHCKIPLIQVSPDEVKMAATGRKTATKAEMIEWAVKHYPDAGWLRRGGNVLGKNEHLADATAAIKAGVKTLDFQNARAILQFVA